MLHLTHIFSIIYIYVAFNLYVSNTVVTHSDPSSVTQNFKFNRMNNLLYGKNLYLKRKFPSFEAFDIFKFFVIAFIIIFLLYMILLHLCNYVRYVTFSTNLTLNRKKKYISGSPRSILSIVSLLLVGLLSTEST